MTQSGRIFDAHFHIIDPAFPLVPNNGYLPPAYGVGDYLAAVASLGVMGGAVVSGSFQAFDQAYLTAALQALGPSYVGVTQLPTDVTDEEILRLHGLGVRAVRFNLYRGGSADIGAARELARRAHDLAGWHAEFYVDGKDIAELSPLLSSLPQVVIDHLGMTAAGTAALTALAAKGAKVKATGFGRVVLDVAKVAKAIAAANPHALMFGTDLPSTRARRPFVPADIDLLREALGQADAGRAFLTNAVELYRPTRTTV
jgi:predicted TIM-barrel fold metal-dependent hydrolase